jgi:hypothetical protein
MRRQSLPKQEGAVHSIVACTYADPYPRPTNARSLHRLLNKATVQMSHDHLSCQALKWCVACSSGCTGLECERLFRAGQHTHIPSLLPFMALVVKKKNIPCKTLINCAIIDPLSRINIQSI